MTNKFILTIVMVCCSLMAWAQTKYEVTANSFLNIRSYAATDAPILGTIDKGGTVDVLEIKDGWAKIQFDGGEAYVSSEFLRPVRKVAKENVTPSKSIGSSFSGWSLHKSDVRWLTYVIAALSAVLLIIRLHRGDNNLRDGEHTLNWVVFLTTCVLELVYVLNMGSDSIWFCIPNTVGWLWTIIDFFIFGFLVYNQLLCFFNTLVDAQYNSYGGFDSRWGIYSWIGGVIGAIICGIFFQPALPFVGIAFLICQIIQIVLIFKGILPSGGWGNALLCLGVYLLGSVATVLILAHFVILLLIVLVGLFILSILGKASSSSGKGCCTKCYYFNKYTDYCDYHHGYVSEPDNKTCGYFR